MNSCGYTAHRRGQKAAEHYPQSFSRRLSNSAKTAILHKIDIFLSILTPDFSQPFYTLETDVGAQVIHLSTLPITTTNVYIERKRT